MNDPRDERLERASAIFAHAAVFALASTLIELACTIGMATTEVEGIRIEPNVVRVGALLRFPLAFLIGALFGATSGPKAEAKTRFLLPSLFAAPWFLVEALEYRTLGTTGGMPRLSLLLSPAELFRGPHLLTALLLVTAAVLATLFVPHRLVGLLRARFERQGVLAADAVGIGVAALIPLGAMAAGSPSLYYGAVPAPVHLLVGKTPRPEAVAEPHHHHHDHDGGAPEAYPDEPEPEDGIPRPPADVRMLLYALEGVEAPLPLPDTGRPFCREAVRPARLAAANSVLLLVLHGVGTREMQAQFGGRPAMPSLARIAADGVSFTSFHAVSDRGDQGTVSLLAGVPLLAPSTYVEAHVPPRLPSLARDLGALGYDTFLVHGGEPGLGAMSTLVRSLGFGRYDTSPRDEWTALRSFGLPDATTLERLQASVTAQRREHADRPYLGVATLFGTAEPYAVPEGSEAIATGEGPWEALGNAVRATDAALGRFYEWYLAEEAPKGTLLVVTSDRASSLHVANEARSETEPTRTRFEIPLVIAGLPRATRDAVRANARRNGGQADVAPTVLGLLGAGPFGCYRGRDLLGVREPWPVRRLVMAAAGRSQRYLVIFDGRFRWQLDRDQESNGFAIFDLQHDAELRRDLASPDDPQAAQMREYVLSFLTVGNYLVTNDRYLPETPTSVIAAPAPSTTRTVKALGGGGATVAPADLAAAASAGYGGVGLRLDVAEDGRVVVEGTTITLESLLARLPAGLVVVAHLPSFAEVGAPARIARTRALVTALGRIPSGRLILLGPDPALASTLTTYLGAPYYLEPGAFVSRQELVRAALRHGATGVAMPASAGRVGIEEAHQAGLRILLDGTSTYEALGSRPDLWVLSDAAPPAP